MSKNGLMESLPLVSAIVPVYNGACYLEEALRSIFSQTYQPMEVIVINDGSPDDIQAVISKFPKIRLIKQANLGVAAARNKGINIAEGELLTFLDCDDRWLQTKTAQQVDYLQNHLSIDYVTGWHMPFLEKGFDRPVGLNPNQLDHPIPGFMLQALMVRRTAFNTVGFFDETLRSSEDIDWFARAQDKKLNGFMLEDTLFYRRIHGANITYSLPNRQNLLKALHASIQRKRQSRPEDEALN